MRNPFKMPTEEEARPLDVVETTDVDPIYSIAPQSWQLIAKS